MIVLSRMYLRSSFTYTMREPRTGVGRRTDKLYLIVKHAHDGDRLMVMTKKGEKSSLPAKSEAARVIFCQLMVNIRHSFVLPTLDFDYVSDKGLAISFREWVPKGSLRDVIRSVNPTKEYKIKYSKPASSPLSEERIALWGRQILEGLAFFRSIDFPIKHLHAGNIIVENSICRISDYENSILEVASLFPPETRAKMSIDDDVIGFGRVLYEMVAGYELTTLTPEYYPPSVNAFMRELLDSIFCPADGVGVSIDDILALDYFSDVDLRMQIVNSTPAFDEKTKDFLAAVNKGARIKPHSVKKLENKRKEGKKSKKIGPPGSSSSSSQLLLTSGSSSSGSSSNVNNTANNNFSSAASTTGTIAPSVAATTKSTKSAMTSTSSSTTGAAPAPPPPPPPPPAVAASMPPPQEGRNALLDSIQKGKKLKKTTTVDKSAPKLK